MDKIVLIGYMASGKSAVGKVLAKQLNCEFIDLDAYIELKEGKTISDIFNENGEIYFRLKESEYLSELLSKKGRFIVSLGGGTPCYANNIDLIIEKSKSFYLRTSINTLYERLVNEKSLRPLVAKLEADKLKEFIAKHIFERAPYYEQASLAVTTDGNTIEQVVSLINEQLV